MTAINIIATLITLFLIWLFYEAVKFEKSKKREVEIVQDIPIGHTVYDLFPEWAPQIATQLDEDAAFCNLYLIAKDITEHGLSVKNMIELKEHVKNCKRHFV